MKWIQILLFLAFIGCETPQKRPVRHHWQHRKKTVIVYDDDAALRALIKSLRE